MRVRKPRDLRRAQNRAMDARFVQDVQRLLQRAAEKAMLRQGYWSGTMRRAG